MSDDSNTDATARRLHAFALLSTLRTAAEVGHAMRERRAGRDPSAQESEGSVRAYLRGALPELRGHVAALRLSLVVEREGEAAFVQAFEDRTALARLAREFHVVHQRLLSLYPEVPESLIEAARLRQQEAEGLATAAGDGFRGVLEGWIGRAAAFCEGLEKALPETN